MRKRIFGLVVVVIAIIAAFYFYRGHQSSETSHDSFSRQKTKTQQQLTLLEKSDSSSSSDTAPSSIGVSPTTLQNQESRDISCWKKIDAGVSTENFRAYNRHFLSQHVGEWYFSEENNGPVATGPTAEGKFTLALARAGLLVGRTIDLDDGEALSLLREASELDPKNSAPLLYSAVIESRRGNSQRADELLQQARRSETFDSYISTISKSIFARVRTPSDLFAAYGLWGVLPIPDYLALGDFLKNHDGEFFAHQLTKGGLSDKSTLNDIEWFALEYAVGKSVLDKFQPNNKLPTFQDVLKRKKELSPVNIDTLYAEMDSTCDIASWGPMVDLIQSRLGNSK